ncbi:MAG: 2-succinyl-6-hydroxy-2,4-cyclohexadiene-1-carboxylate synthase [bacterium]|nr:2-succinyl-6-hydroxy-2,4-cyclohexadiene-1-carboxylate synthase [bacterium]
MTTMTYITLNSTLYAVHQAGIGAPVLILHGFTGDGASFIGNLPHLINNYRLIAPDLLGHGITESPQDPARYRIENAVADLASLLDYLKITSCPVLGYSMGGRLALALAIFHPERVSKLILESSSAGLELAQERLARITSDESLAERIITGGIESFVAEWENLPLWKTQSPALREKLRENRLKNNPLGLANSLRGMGTGAQPSFWDKLGALAMPTLLITGAEDDKFTRIAHQMGEKIPDVRIETIPNAGHTVHLEAPEAYQHIVADFLGYNQHNNVLQS